MEGMMNDDDLFGVGGGSHGNTNALDVSITEDVANGLDVTDKLLDQIANEKKLDALGGIISDVPLKVGDKYKITGGKYKKFKIGTLVKINGTYSDVKVLEDAVMMATGNIGSDKLIKVKNTYLFPVEVPGFEMPDAEDLMVVENLDNYLEANPPLGEEEETEDITAILPTIDEALQLRNDNISLKKEIEVLKEEHANTIENMVDMSQVMPKCGLTDTQLGEIITLLVKFKV